MDVYVSPDYNPNLNSNSTSSSAPGSDKKRNIFLIISSFVAVTIILVGMAGFFYFQKNGLDFLKKGFFGVDNQPVPSPRVVNIINKKTGKGQFALAEPAVSKTTSAPAPAQKQVIVEGNYAQSTQKIDIKVSTESSNLPQSPTMLLSLLPDAVKKGQRILIQLEIIYKEKTSYSTVLTLSPTEAQGVIPFKVILPYNYPDFKLRFSDVSNKTLLSQDVKL